MCCGNLVGKRSQSSSPPAAVVAVVQNFAVGIDFSDFAAAQNDCHEFAEMLASKT
jgi:hypothetical protein